MKIIGSIATKGRHFAGTRRSAPTPTAATSPVARRSVAKWSAPGVLVTIAGITDIAVVRANNMAGLRRWPRKPRPANGTIAGRLGPTTTCHPRALGNVASATLCPLVFFGAQALPSHQRCADPPSGSGYQPGAAVVSTETELISRGAVALHRALPGHDVRGYGPKHL